MRKQNKIGLIILIIGFIMIGVGLTMNFLASHETPLENVVNTPPLVDKNTTGGLIFSAIDNSIYIENVMPTLDKFGVMEKGFSFSIKNNNTKAIEYELKLIDDNSTINNNDIRYELTKNNEILGIYTLGDDGIIDKSTIYEDEEINYTIKLWLDYNSEVKIGQFSKKIMVNETSNTTNEINRPILVEGMIPVYYDNNTNNWYKAREDNLLNRWYSYDKALWANAVTVNANKRKVYQESEVGTKIELSDINSMWVWIPRFNYVLKGENIEISFAKTNEEAYQVFKFNDEELSGFWFSKFESGMKSNSECISSNLTKKCNNSSNELYFVPNYPFATKMTMANMFYAIRNMELKNNIYGFNGTGNKVNIDGTIIDDNNNIDIHMIKNSEWQAVALLSNSKYGNNKQITNNNMELTGKSHYENSDYDYNVSIKGTSASTTGNVLGIYDMAGGKREYVMINDEKIDLFNKMSNSGFTTAIKKYYYDNGLNAADTTILLKEKYGNDNVINNNPITRGGYKNTGNIFNLYGPSDYIDKISLETNSRACLVIKEKNNEEKES